MRKRVALTVSSHPLPPPSSPHPSSFFQSVCVLGYCVCPLVIAAVLGLISRAALWRAPLALAALVWSCRASVVFLAGMVSAPRQLLAVYPVALFYAVVAWVRRLAGGAGRASCGCVVCRRDLTPPPSPPQMVFVQ